MGMSDGRCLLIGRDFLINVKSECSESFKVPSTGVKVRGESGPKSLKKTLANLLSRVLTKSQCFSDNEL
jgi:hypothetical protein